MSEIYKCYISIIFYKAGGKKDGIVSSRKRQWTDTIQRIERKACINTDTQIQVSCRLLGEFYLYEKMFKRLKTSLYYIPHKTIPDDKRHV